MICQGRKWLWKTGWASSNAARRRCPAAPSILTKTGWAIAHPAHPPVTPLYVLIFWEKSKVSTYQLISLCARLSLDVLTEIFES